MFLHTHVIYKVKVDMWISIPTVKISNSFEMLNIKLFSLIISNKFHITLTIRHRKHNRDHGIEKNKKKQQIVMGKVLLQINNCKELPCI